MNRFGAFKNSALDLLVPLTSGTFYQYVAFQAFTNAWISIAPFYFAVYLARIFLVMTYCPPRVRECDVPNSQSRQPRKLTPNIGRTCLQCQRVFMNLLSF